VILLVIVITVMDAQYPPLIFAFTYLPRENREKRARENLVVYSNSFIPAISTVLITLTS